DVFRTWRAADRGRAGCRERLDVRRGSGRRPLRFLRPIFRVAHLMIEDRYLVGRRAELPRRIVDRHLNAMFVDGGAAAGGDEQQRQRARGTKNAERGMRSHFRPNIRPLSTSNFGSSSVPDSLIGNTVPAPSFLNSGSTTFRKIDFTPPTALDNDASIFSVPRKSRIFCSS